MTQLSLLDVIESHGAENNRESEQHYEKNAAHFGKQCQKVYGLLVSGERLTVLSAITRHGISSLPRRILDLKRCGVKIKDSFVIVDGKAKYKEYYL